MERIDRRHQQGILHDNDQYLLPVQSRLMHHVIGFTLKFHLLAQRKSVQSLGVAYDSLERASSTGSLLTMPSLKLWICIPVRSYCGLVLLQLCDQELAWQLFYRRGKRMPSRGLWSSSWTSYSSCKGLMPKVDEWAKPLITKNRQLSAAASIFRAYISI